MFTPRLQHLMVFMVISIYFSVISNRKWIHPRPRSRLCLLLLSSVWHSAWYLAGTRYILAESVNKWHIPWRQQPDNRLEQDPVNQQGHVGCIPDGGHWGETNFFLLISSPVHKGNFLCNSEDVMWFVNTLLERSRISLTLRSNHRSRKTSFGSGTM